MYRYLSRKNRYLYLVMLYCLLESFLLEFQLIVQVVYILLHYTEYKLIVFRILTLLLLVVFLLLLEFLLSL